MGESYGAVIGLMPRFHRLIFTMMPPLDVEKAAKGFIEGQVLMKEGGYDPNDQPTCIVENWL